MKGIQRPRHRHHALHHTRDADRLAAAQVVDHVGVGIGCEGLDRPVGGFLDHRRIDSYAVHAAGGGDRAVDGDLPGEFEVDRAADVEQDGADRHVASAPSARSLPLP